MRIRLLSALVALACVPFAQQARAQFTDAHAYDPTPVGTNQLEIGYAHVRADASIDTSLVITGARVDVDQGLVDYTRWFGAFHRLMWVEAALPVARLSGSIEGTGISRDTTGVGDSNYQVGILLIGGPALSVDELAEAPPSTGLGLSLTTTAPTGSYDPNKVLNLGSDRWSFKPELAVRHPFGPEKRWQVDGYVNVAFFTDNTSFHGTEILRQEPLTGLEAHVSYSFTDSLWLALDARYAFRGATSVDGVDQNNAQKNLLLGTELNATINSRNAFLVTLAKAVVHENAPSTVGFSVKYDFLWGKGYR
jgi:hypothetical protein